MPLLPSPAGAVKKLPTPAQPILPDPTRLEMGTFSTETLVRFLLDLNFALAKELGNRPTRDQARDHLYLYSPNGSVWSVTVSNAGALTTTKVFDNA